VEWRNIWENAGERVEIEGEISETKIVGENFLRRKYGDRLQISYRVSGYIMQHVTNCLTDERKTM
jgi:hypothetical protein